MFLGSLAALAITGAGTAWAQQGVTPDTVTFAQVAVLDGPAAALGTGMNLGLRAAFEEANRAGGVHGRMVRLDAFDDGYEPELSATRAREVIAGDAHIAFIGPVGTPTSQATQPLSAEAGMPFIAPFTGAAFLRDPALTNVFNVRASYDAETEAWIRHLVDEKGLTKIAILYQDDGFGRAGLSGTVAALERRGMALVAEATFARNTTAVRSALLDLRRAEPEAVVMVGPYLPMAEFIRTARQVSFEADFVNISFVGTDALVTELGADGAGVIISQVVPYPTDTSIPVVARYTQALAAVDPAAKPGFISLEGYLAGRLALAALDAAGPEPTRPAYLAALRAMTTVDVDGMTMSFGPGDNQALDDVFLTVISPAGEITQMGTGG
ncbi:MAG: ABC transporter substrate-binding protein [Rhodobacteraceae bacterium]|jgi:ABC-type branched-subunit amino acid transport system substrate-binding protein|nr:ABC transporter substrate-binding protein [Paracoccaceae bacterium]